MGSGKNRTLAIFLLLSMAFLSGIFALQGALLSAMIEAFDLRASAQGLPNAAAFAGGVAALAIAFAASRKMKKWPMLVGSIALCVLALAGLKAAPGFAAFVAVWCVLGLGMGWMDTLLSACMAELYQGKWAERMMCLLHTAYGVASMAAPALYVRLMDGGMEWKDLYLVAAAFGGGLLILAALTMRLWRGRSAAAKPQDGRRENLWTLIREGKLLWMMAAMFFHGIFLSGLNTWINRFSETVSHPFAGLPAMSFLFFGVMVSRLVVPYLPVKTKTYVKTAGFLACACLTAGVAIGEGLALGVCLALSGLLFGSLLPCMLTLACGRLTEHTLTATTALMLSYYLGEAAASPILGAMESAFSLGAGMILCAALMAGASLCCALDPAIGGRHKKFT